MNNTEITQQQALQTLISAIQVATKRGAFELAETEVLLQAVKVFQTPPGEPKTAPGNTQDKKADTDGSKKK